MKSRLVAAAAAALFLACGQQTTSPDTRLQDFPIILDHVGNDPVVGHLVVCKQGTDATIDIHIEDTLTDPATVTDLDDEAFTAGECKALYSATTLPGVPTPPINVTTTEDAQSGIQLDSITVETRLGPNVSHQKLTGTSTYSDFFVDDKGLVITFWNSALPDGEELIVCKRGTDATIDIHMEDTSTTPPTVTDLDDEPFAAGECKTLFTTTILPGVPTPPVNVTATEDAQSGIQLDSITVETRLGPNTSHQLLTGTNTYSDFIADDKGLTITFWNSIIEEGEGCTPGYWKQDHHLDSWPAGVDADDLFSSVFDLPTQLKKPEHNVDPTTLTLQDALKLRGGGVNALMRHAVAAYLNSLTVSYGMSDAEVVAAFNAAIGGGDIEGTKDTFADANEQGCPLN